MCVCVCVYLYIYVCVCITMSCAHLNEKQIVEEGKYNASSGELNYLNSLLCYVFLAY